MWTKTDRIFVEIFTVTSMLHNGKDAERRTPVNISAQMWKRQKIISQSAANKCCFDLAVYSPASARYPFTPPSCRQSQLAAHFVRILWNGRGGEKNSLIGTNCGI